MFVSVLPMLDVIKEYLVACSAFGYNLKVITLKYLMLPFACYYIRLFLTFCSFKSAAYKAGVLLGFYVIGPIFPDVRVPWKQKEKTNSGCETQNVTSCNRAVIR